LEYSKDFTSSSSLVLFISCEVIALAIATLNQAVFGYNKGIKTEISGYIIIISMILDIDYKLLLIVA
jgi:hypothetical protein